MEENTEQEESVESGFEETSNESIIDTFTDETADDFNVPTEDGEMNYDDMTEEQLDSLITKLESEQGEEEAPTDEFQLPDKFKSTEDLLKSYQMLEGKMGNFVSAPEQYEMTEETTINEELLSELADTAKGLNMSNEAFNAMVNTFEKSTNDLDDINLQDEMAQLGTHAESRINNVNEYLQQNLAPHDVEAIQNMIQTADGLSALESMISNGRPSAPAMSPQHAAAPAQNDIEGMLQAKDEYGNLKMETDEGYNKKVMQMANQYWG